MRCDDIYDVDTRDTVGEKQRERKNEIGTERESGDNAMLIERERDRQRQTDIQTDRHIKKKQIKRDRQKSERD